MLYTQQYGKQNNVQIKFQHIEGILCEHKKTREKEIDLLWLHSQAIYTKDITKRARHTDAFLGKFFNELVKWW